MPLLLSLLIVVSACSSGSSDSGDTQARTINVFEVAGPDAFITKRNTEVEAKKGASLSANTGIRTGAATYTYLELDSTSLVKMDENTRLSVSAMSKSKLSLNLERGSILVNERNSSYPTFEIKAGNAALGVRGTFFTVCFIGDTVVVDLVEGALSVTSEADGTVDVQQGKHITIKPGEAAEIEDIDVSALSGFVLASIIEFKDDIVSSGCFDSEDYDYMQSHYDGETSDSAQSDTMSGDSYDGAPATPQSDSGSESPVPLTSLIEYIKLDKASYFPYENIAASTSNITAQMEYEGANIVIFRKGAGHNWADADGYAYVAQGGSVQTMHAPSAFGEYEMRLYSSNRVYDNSTYIYKTDFVVGAQTKQGQIKTDKPSYFPYESISVFVTGITEPMESNGAYVAIYAVGAEHREYMAYSYVPAGDSVQTLAAPGAFGEYEMRLYCINNMYDDEILVTAARFKVGTDTKQGQVKTDKSSYFPYENIEVFVSGITGPMENNGAFVAVYKAGDEHNEYMSYSYVPAGESVQTLNAPGDFGEYEIRLYCVNGTYTDETFVVASRFTVGTATQQGQLRLDKTTYSPYESIIIDVSDITEPMIDNGALVAIYERGARHEDNRDYSYIVSTGDSTAALSAPNDAGEYEVRLYSTGGVFSDETLVAAVPFTVVDDAAQEAAGDGVSYG